MNDNPLPNDALKDLRQSIDYLDMALMFLLAERIRLIFKVGSIKKRDHIPFEYSEKRETDLKKILSIAAEHKLNVEFVQTLFRCIYDHALLSLFAEPAEITNPNMDFLTLDGLRQNIYSLDLALCSILADRFQWSVMIGRLKKQYRIQPLAPERWQAVMMQRIETANKLGIDSQFVRDIFTIIHHESLRIQELISKQVG